MERNKNNIINDNISPSINKLNNKYTNGAVNNDKKKNISK